MNAETKFIRGFNHGYLVAKYKPKLIKNIPFVKEYSSPYFSGFRLGKEQFNYEKDQIILTELSKLRNRDKDDRTRER